MTQIEIDAFEHEVRRMRQLMGFARGVSRDSLEWGNLDLPWAAHAPRAYARAREALEASITATRRQVDEITAQLTALASAPAPLLGSTAAVELSRRVRNLEAQRATLSKQITAAEERLATALTPAQLTAATQGARRVCATLLATAAQRVARRAQEQIQAARNAAHAVMRDLDAFEAERRAVTAALGEEVPAYDVATPERDALRRLSQVDTAVRLVQRAPAERKAAA